MPNDLDPPLATTAAAPHSLLLLRYGPSLDLLSQRFDGHFIHSNFIP